jgi:hypothetical protein
MRPFLKEVRCWGSSSPSSASVDPQSHLLISPPMFLRVLGKVRAGNPKGIDGYDLHREFPLVYSPTFGEDGVTVEKLRGTLVTGGKEVDWSRVEYPLPSFLVWGEQWEVLPDMHFVTEENAVKSAKHVARQVGIRRQGGPWERDGQDGWHMDRQIGGQGGAKRGGWR